MGKFDKQPRSPGDINREKNQRHAREDPRETWCPCLEVTWAYLWLWGHMGIEELLTQGFTQRGSFWQGEAGWVLSLQYPTSAKKVGHTRQVLFHNWYLGCMHISFLDASSPFGNHQLNLHNESLKEMLLWGNEAKKSGYFLSLSRPGSAPDPPWGLDGPWTSEVHYLICKFEPSPIKWQCSIHPTAFIGYVLPYH